LDYVPESYVPGEDVRDLRTIVQHRASLVRLRTAIKNTLLALSEIGEVERFRNTKSLPENLQSAKRKKAIRASYFS